jgi:hypothetical protein
VLSHVLLPDGLAISLGIKNYQTGKVVRESLIGRFGEHEEQIHPGPRSYDGGYTELNWKNDGLEILFQSMVRDGELYLLATPLKQVLRAPALLVEMNLLWNQPGMVSRSGRQLLAQLPARSIVVSMEGEELREMNTGATGPYVAILLDRPVVICTGEPVGACMVREWLDASRAALLAGQLAYGDSGELYGAMRTCLAWDTIYEPEKDQVCTPVSRLWNLGWGGYVLFCWDTYFAAMMCMIDNPDLASANAIAITREKTESGFVPNFGASNDFKSRDRSQPPVGSMAVREIYRIHRERWLIEELFDELLTWNRWWKENRVTPDNVLCWGSNPFEPRSGTHWELNSVNDTAGAALESGLDNSPMYDDVPFDNETHLMQLADVGLTGLYIMDCEALADLAAVIGRSEELELRERAEQIKDGLETLWDDETGIYQNRRTDTGEFYRRISPTNFYALYSDKVSPERAERMMREHFYNADEFWGEYIIPSISRNDPAYPEQDYWRGRIWAPMNYLAYLAMRRHGLPEACRDLADKSAELFMLEWKTHGHVHENYDGNTGLGCGVRNSDKFYHWGALLALIALTESGAVSGPEMPL